MRVSVCLSLIVGLCHCQRLDPGDAHAGASTDEAAAVNPQLTTYTQPKVRLACPSPSLAQCRSPLWRWTRCGKLEMARARLDPESPCNLLLGEAAQALSAYLPTREVVAPSVVSATGVVSAATRRDGNDCLADVGHTCVRYQPYSNNGHFARGFGSTSYGLATKGMSFLPLDNHSEEAARYRMMNAIRDAIYAGNGNAVASCGEYVYEKYFDYSTFEEVSARYGNTARSFVDTAYAASDLRSSIGTRWIAGMPLAGRDGTPFTDGIAFPTNQKKNVFFETPVVTDETTGGLGVRQEVEMPCFSRDAVSVGGVYLNDETLTALLLQDPRHDESFAWHRDMSHLRGPRFSREPNRGRGLHRLRRQMEAGDHRRDRIDAGEHPRSSHRQAARPTTMLRGWQGAPRSSSIPRPSRRTISSSTSSRATPAAGSSWWRSSCDRASSRGERREPPNAGGYNASSAPMTTYVWGAPWLRTLVSSQQCERGRSETRSSSSVPSARSDCRIAFQVMTCATASRLAKAE